MTARRLVLPVAVFVSVLVVHAVLVVAFPDVDPVQSEWMDVPSVDTRPWHQRYADQQAWWLGLSYASSFTFAVAAFRRWREARAAAAGRAALGGLGLAGVLSAAGCFLVGCCGSPMLAVWTSLLGARFLPLAGPFVLLATLVMLGVAWRWLDRRLAAAGGECACPTGPGAC